MIGRGIIRGGALTLAAALAVAGPTGCDDGDYDEQVVDEGRELLENGIHFNGIHFNGIHFNGIHFNGTWTGAVPGWLEFLGMYLNGVSVKNLKMNGNRIVGTVGGVYHSGKQFEGAIVDVDYIDMKEIAAYLVQFRLASSSVIITAIGTELDAFTIYYRIPGSVEVGEWQPTCPDGAPAITLKGQWDPVTWDRISDEGVTLACVGGILADCAIWGYDPAVQDYSGEDLARYHDACMRAKPADYCGDRTPHTEDGTPVDFYDDLDIQESETSWEIEAMWGENGAICLNQPRKLEYTKDPMGDIYIGCEIPDCVDVDGDGDIDLDDYPDALIGTKAQPS